jgi:glutamate-1-semialdehyde 2,1-aminomutase
VAAGLATLRLLQSTDAFDRAATATQSLVQGLVNAARRHGLPFSAQGIGSMFGLYFRAGAPASFAEVMQCDAAAFNRFFHGMLEQGIYLAPSAYEAGFVSAAHGEAEISETLAAADAVFGGMKTA